MAGMDWKTLTKQQQIVSRVLQHALQRRELAHAYLLEGPRGTGKRQAALLLAQTIFCETPKNGEPCQQCRNCRRIASGNHPDVIRVSPDEGAAAIKKEQIAYLMKEFALHGVESSRKIFIIEGAEKMTIQAENSLLKFIEEPHTGTLALLTADHIHQLLDTIISRCQVLTFKPLSDRAVEKGLEEVDQPHQLSRLAAELTHNAEEAADLCTDPWFAGARSQVLQLVQSMNNSSEPVLPFIYEKFSPNFDSIQRMTIGLDLLLFWYRDALSLQLGRSDAAVIYDDQVEVLKNLVIRMSPDQVLQSMALILEARKQLDAHVNGLSVLERLVIRLGGIR